MDDVLGFGKVCFFFSDFAGLEPLGASLPRLSEPRDGAVLVRVAREQASRTPIDVSD